MRARFDFPVPFALPDPMPDPVHLLASLCNASREAPLPLIAAAVGSHPIEWHELTRGDLRPPAGTYAIGLIGGGSVGKEDVLVAFVVDLTGRQRAVIFRRGSVIDTATPSGMLVDDCRAALGLPRAA